MQKNYSQQPEEQSLPRKETLAFIANYSLKVSLLSLQIKSLNRTIQSAENWKVN